jgi:DNA-binding transcriptional LysR family regulator
MDGAALLILSGQHLGFLPQFYGAKHEALGQLHPLNPEELSYEVVFHAAVRHSTRQHEVVSNFLTELIDIFGAKSLNA